MGGGSSTNKAVKTEAASGGGRSAGSGAAGARTSELSSGNVARSDAPQRGVPGRDEPIPGGRGEDGWPSTAEEARRDGGAEAVEPVGDVERQKATEAAAVAANALDGPPPAAEDPFWLLGDVDEAVDRCRDEQGATGEESSTYNDETRCSSALDGRGQDTIAHTAEGQPEHWLRVALPAYVAVGRVEIVNRRGQPQRCRRLVVELLAGASVIWKCFVGMDDKAPEGPPAKPRTDGSLVELEWAFSPDLRQRPVANGLRIRKVAADGVSFYGEMGPDPTLNISTISMFGPTLPNATDSAAAALAAATYRRVGDFATAAALQAAVAHYAADEADRKSDAEERRFDVLRRAYCRASSTWNFDGVEGDHGPCEAVGGFGDKSGPGNSGQTTVLPTFFKAAGGDADAWWEGWLTHTSGRSRVSRVELVSFPGKEFRAFRVRVELLRVLPLASGEKVDTGWDLAPGADGGVGGPGDRRARTEVVWVSPDVADDGSSPPEDGVCKIRMPVGGVACDVVRIRRVAPYVDGPAAPGDSHLQLRAVRAIGVPVRPLPPLAFSGVPPGPDAVPDDVAAAGRFDAAVDHAQHGFVRATGPAYPWSTTSDAGKVAGSLVHAVDGDLATAGLTLWKDLQPIMEVTPTCGRLRVARVELVTHRHWNCYRSLQRTRVELWRDDAVVWWADVAETDGLGDVADGGSDHFPEDGEVTVDVPWVAADRVRLRKFPPFWNGHRRGWRSFQLAAFRVRGAPLSTTIPPAVADAQFTELGSGGDDALVSKLQFDWARGGLASQSRPFWAANQHLPSWAVDGRSDRCSSTGAQDDGAPWWAVQLPGGAVRVRRVEIEVGQVGWAPSDATHLQDTRVEVLRAGVPVYWQDLFCEPGSAPKGTRGFVTSVDVPWAVGDGVRVRKLRIREENETRRILLGKVSVYGMGVRDAEPVRDVALHGLASASSVCPRHSEEVPGGWPVANCVDGSDDSEHYCLMRDDDDDPWLEVTFAGGAARLRRVELVSPDGHAHRMMDIRVEVLLGASVVWTGECGINPKEKYPDGCCVLTVDIPSGAVGDGVRLSRTKFHSREPERSFALQHVRAFGTPVETEATVHWEGTGAAAVGGAASSPEAIAEADAEAEAALKRMRALSKEELPPADSDAWTVGDGAENVDRARAGTATQSGYWNDEMTAAAAIDGRGSLAHTNADADEHWMRIDLPTCVAVRRVEVMGRDGYPQAMQRMRLELLYNETVVWHKDVGMRGQPKCVDGTNRSDVKIKIAEAEVANGFRVRRLARGEAGVFACTTKEDRDACLMVCALRVFGKTLMDATEAAAVADGTAAAAEKELAGDAPVAVHWKAKAVTGASPTFFADDPVWSVVAEGDGADASVDRARSGEASHSSGWGGDDTFPASNAIDGKDGETFTHTSGWKDHHWIQVVLPAFVAARKVEILGRPGYPSRMERTRAQLLQRGHVVWQTDIGMGGEVPPDRQLDFDLSGRPPVCDTLRLRKLDLEETSYRGKMRGGDDDTFNISAMRVCGPVVTATGPLPEALPTKVDINESANADAAVAGAANRHAHFDLYRDADKDELPPLTLWTAHQTMWNAHCAGDWTSVLDLACTHTCHVPHARQFLGDHNWSNGLGFVARALMGLAEEQHVPGLRTPAREVILMCVLATPVNGARGNIGHAGPAREWALHPEEVAWTQADLGRVLRDPLGKPLRDDLPARMKDAALAAADEEDAAAKAARDNPGQAQAGLEEALPGLAEMREQADAARAFDAQVSRAKEEAVEEKDDDGDGAAAPAATEAGSGDDVAASDAAAVDPDGEEDAEATFARRAEAARLKSPIEVMFKGATELIDEADDEAGDDADGADEAKEAAAPPVTSEPSRVVDNPSTDVADLAFSGAWRGKDFTGKLCQPFISNTDIEGGGVGSSVLFHRATLQDVLDDTAAAAPGLVGDDHALAAVRRVLAVLDRAVHIDEGTPARVKRLVPGQSLMLIGGWTNVKSDNSHAMCYVISKIDEHFFSLAVCNGGAGCGTHPSFGGGLYPASAVRCMMLKVPKERMLDMGTWMWLRRATGVASIFHDGSFVYDYVLPEFSPTRVLSDIAAEDKDALNRGNDYVMGQQSGTCYLRSPSIAVRLLLRREGLSIDQYKMVSFAQRRYLLRRAHNDLAVLARRSRRRFHRTPIIGSNVSVLEFACRQVALKALKESVADRLPLSGVKDMHDCVASVRRLVEKLVRPYPGPPLLESCAMRREDATVSYDLLDIVPAHAPASTLDALIAKSLHGKEVPLHRDPYLDLMAADRCVDHGAAAGPPGMASMLLSIRATEALCEALFDEHRKSMDSGPLMQLVAQVAHTFTRLLPVPLPEGANDDCPWQARPPTRNEQSMATQSLGNIAVHYTAAAKCVPQTREAVASRVVTMAAIVVLVDKMVRYPTQLPLSRVLNSAAAANVRLDTATWVSSRAVSFDTATENLLATDPAVAQTRRAAVAYMAAQASARPVPLLDLRSDPTALASSTVHDSTFCWDKNSMMPTQHFVEWLCASIGIAHSNKPSTYTPPVEVRKFEGDKPSIFEWRVGWLLDLGVRMPEFGVWRDVSALFKASLDGWAPPKEKCKPLAPMWKVVEGDKGGNKACVSLTLWGGSSHVVPGTKVLPTSDADAGRLLQSATGLHISEEDISHAHKLPSFGDTLSQEDSEQLLAALAAPYLRIPLVLRFFSESRLGALFNPQLQRSLVAALFEVGPYAPATPTATGGAGGASVSAAADRVGNSLASVPVPSELRAIAYGSPTGLFDNELSFSAAVALEPLLAIGGATLELPQGGAYDSLVLFVFRLMVAAEAHVEGLCRRSSGAGDAAGGSDLERYRSKLREFIRVKARHRVETMLEACAAEADPSDSGTVKMCRLHAHSALLHSNVDASDMTAEGVGEACGSLAHVNGWHERPRVSVLGVSSMMEEGAATLASAVVNDDSGLQMSMSLLYDLAARQRAAVCRWVLETATAEERNTALTIVARRATGRGEDLAFEEFSVADAEQPLRFAARSASPSGSVQSVVVDLCLCTVYFEGQTVQLLPSKFRARPELQRFLHGHERPHCVPRLTASNLEWVTAWWGGSTYDLQLWRAPRTTDVRKLARDGIVAGLPMPTTESSKCDTFEYNGTVYGRPYRPRAREPSSEAWLRSPKTSPLPAFIVAMYLGQYSSCGASTGLPLHTGVRAVKWGDMLLPVEPVAPDAKQATLLMLVRVRMSGRRSKVQEWREVVVHRSRRVVVMFRLLHAGRRVFRQQIFASDHRYSLMDGTPLTVAREELAPCDMLRCCGDLAVPVPTLQDGLLASTLVMRRDGLQTLPPHLLVGSLPAAILDDYILSAANDDATELVGTPHSGADSAWVADRLTIAIGGAVASVKCERAVPGSAGHHALVLVDLLRVPKESPLHRLSTVLARLDSFAHILVWCYESDGRLALVELPRMKLRFVPGTDARGEQRIYSVDYAGMFISDRRSKDVEELIAGLDTAVVLQDAGNALHVLLPAADLYRPEIKSVPFTTHVVVDREGHAWRDAIPGRAFLYAIHSSEAFLVPPSLAAAFYLALYFLMRRRYRDACRVLMSSCQTDQPFTADVRHVVNQFPATKDDVSPDAAAVRARLVLVTLFSGETPPVGVDTSVLGNQHHVSSECALSLAEIRLLARRVKGAKPDDTYEAWLHYREVAWAVGQPGGAGAPDALGGEVKSKFEFNRETKPGATGEKWEQLRLDEELDRVRTAAAEYFGVGGEFCRHNQHFAAHKIKYRRFGGFARSVIGSGESDTFIEMLLEDAWTGTVGSTNALAFGACYELLTGTVRLIPGGVHGDAADASRTAALLAVRLAFCAASSLGLDDNAKLLFTILSMVHDAVAERGAAAQRALPRFPLLAKNKGSFASEGLDPMEDNELRKFFKALFTALFNSAECAAALSGPRDRGTARSAVTAVVDVHTAAFDNAQLTRPGHLVRDSLRHEATCVRPELAATTITSVPLLAHEGLKEAVDSFVSWEDAGGASVSSAAVLPFDLSWSPVAASAAARDDLSRLHAEFSTYARQVNESRKPVMLAKVARDAAGGKIAQEKLSKLVDLLENAEEKSVQHAVDAVHAAAAIANGVHTSDAASDGLSSWHFALQRQACLAQDLDVAFIAAALASTTGSHDLQRANRTLDSATSAVLRDATAIALLLVNRRRLLSVALADATALLALVEAGGWGTRKCEQACETLAGRLYAQRSYGRLDGDKWSYDPRFLCFEFQQDVLLRPRQVQLVTDFVHAALGNKSKVRQMIMGAGKTTVVAPLAALMLADGAALVTSVVPNALLDMSISVARSRFNTVLRKGVYSLRFDRLHASEESNVTAIVSKLRHAQATAGLVVTTPDAIKSLTLKWVELRKQLHASVREGGVVDIASKKAVWVQLTEVLRMWGRGAGHDFSVSLSGLATPSTEAPVAGPNGGVLIIDEVDVVLHPLTSELNFPIGSKKALEPRPERWDLPMFLLDGVLYFEQRALSETDVVDPMAPDAEGERAHALLEQLAQAVQAGVDSHWLQCAPHLVLLQRPKYAQSLRPLVAEWAMLWLRARWEPPLPTDLSDSDAIAYLCGAPLGGDVALRVGSCLERSPRNLQLLNMAREWCVLLLPHALSKRDRVNYGLLSEEGQEGLNGDAAPPSRFLCAVPFVGLDTPSPTSEFAHPDVQIALTALAFRYEGLRQFDAKAIVLQLKRDVLHEAGAMRERPSYQRYDAWIHGGAHGSSGGALPLDLCQPSEAEQLADIWKSLRNAPGAVYHYLRNHVFPAAMRLQTVKLSASGQELGSDMLFARRIGFSGTPSNLLPTELVPCGFEEGSDGKVVSVLTSPSIVAHHLVRGSWDVESLLRWVANAKPAFNALIDTGALITGKTNESTARFLLQNGLPDMDAVCFLNDDDRPMVIVRGQGSAPQPLSLCGVKLTRMFTYYDDVHTTGTDIKQHPNARAALTLGKDMTLRDAAQGAWRMRQLGVGQTLAFVVIPQMAQLVNAQLDGGRGVAGLERGKLMAAFRDDANADDGNAAVIAALVAWLTLSGVKKAATQHSQLRLQNARTVYRRAALRNLLPSGDPTEVTKDPAQLGNGKARRALDVFQEKVEFDISADVMPPPTAQQELVEWMKGFSDIVSDRAAEAAMGRLFGAAAPTDASHASGDGGDPTSLSSEMTREQEQEVEQEQEQEIEREVIPMYARDPGGELRWSLAALAGDPDGLGAGDGETVGGFYPLSEFALTDLGGAAIKSLPASARLSQNLARKHLVSTAPRRLKNVTVLLEWLRRGTSGPVADASDRVLVAVSLQEAEAVRRAIHVRHPSLGADAALALRLRSGQLLDATAAFGVTDAAAAAAARLALRFFNADTFFSHGELRLLAGALAGAAPHDRMNFFMAVQSCRRRERRGASDTPLLALLTEGGAAGYVAHTLWACGWCGLVNNASRRRCGACRRPRIAFEAFDTDGDGRISVAEHTDAAEAAHRKTLLTMARRWRSRVVGARRR